MSETLTVFLNARLDEDQGVATAALPNAGPHFGLFPENAAHVIRHDPARVLREVEAKRKILAEHPLTERIVRYGRTDHPFGCETCHDWDGATEGLGYCQTLRALAAVYSDHPDYDPAWAR